MNDPPWKDALTRYLPEFMGLYFPPADAEIDWPQPHVLLEQELTHLALVDQWGSDTSPIGLDLAY